MVRPSNRSLNKSLNKSLPSSRRESSIGGGDASEVRTQSAFNRGSIVRIRLKDFMTYKDVEVIAGPHLNLILGPNGTGKSALVCGVIMGLGGEPSTTGRASHIGEYIRFGCETAKVEIELYNNYGRNNIIERHISSRKNRGKDEFHSRFRIDGKDVTKKEVTDFMRSLNIRVDNLCQFLPQERVIEFVKMDQKTILENTERAAGDIEMFDNHCLAVQLSKDIQGLVNQNQKLTNVIATESEQQARAEEELKRVQEREKLRDEVQWLEKKKPWIEFEEKRIAYTKAKESFDEKKKTLQSKEQTIEPLKKEMDTAKKEQINCDNQLKSINEKIKITAKDIEPAKCKVEKSVEKNNSVRQEFQFKMDSEKKRRNRLKQFNAELSVMQNAYRTLEEVNVEPEIESVIREIKNVDHEMRKIQNEKHETKEKIERLTGKRNESVATKERISDMFARRLEKLNELNYNARKAYDWLQINKHKFSGTIYPPIMTQINMKKKEHSKYVESAISKNDMSVFICEDSNDLQQFTQLIKNELNIRVNVAMAPKETPNDFVASHSVESLRKYGIYTYIKDMFTAPDAVMTYLCKSFHIHDIPVGDESTDNHIERLQQYNFRRIYSQKQSHNIQVSRYDQQRVTTTDTVPEAKFLHFVVDERLLKETEKIIEDLQQQINDTKEHYQRIDSNEKGYENKMNDLQKQKKDLYAKKNERRLLETRIEQKNQEIARIERESIDLETEKVKLRDYIRKNIDSHISCVKHLTQCIAECEEKAKERIRIMIKESISKKKFIELEKKYHSADDTLRDLKNEINRLSEILQPLKTEAQRLRRNAVQKTGFDYKDVSEEIKKKFNELPETVDEIDAKIVTLRMRIESIFDTDDSVREDYDRRQKSIENRRKHLQNQKRELKEKQTRLEAVKNRWIPALEQLIERINTNFSQFMARLRCAGEVSLYKGTDPDLSFDEYGIAIKVKFRDTEQLSVLSSFLQSGGERSVSTMVYMIALQEMTKAPFRCVDEINQGMDEANERAVFDLISETSERNASQYFLFSPKLLPNLTYTDKMTIHVIFNGPHFHVNWSEINKNDDQSQD